MLGSAVLTLARVGRQLYNRGCSRLLHPCDEASSLGFEVFATLQDVSWMLRSIYD